MSTNKLSDRGQALEGKFFAEQDAKLMAALREKLAHEQAHRDLSTITGIEDDAALDKIVDLGVTPQTLAALVMIPLLHVAWGDNKLDDEERKAVLSAATSLGIPDGPAHELLESWLTETPNPELFSAWSEYMHALKEHLSGSDIEAMKNRVLRNATAVAAASGGFMGIGKVSGDERKALDEIEAIFA